MEATTATATATCYARLAEGAWATAGQYHELASHARELASHENGAGPMTTEAARLETIAAEHQAYGDDMAQEAIENGWMPE